MSMWPNLIMKVKFTILFILNSLAIVLLTYSLLHEIEFHAQINIIILIIILELLSIFTILKLYLKYMGRPLRNDHMHDRRAKNLKRKDHA